MDRSTLNAVLLAIVSVIISSGQKIVDPPFTISTAMPRWQYEHSEGVFDCGARLSVPVNPKCPGLKEVDWFRYGDDGKAERILNQVWPRISIVDLSDPPFYGRSLTIKDFRKSDDRDYACIVQCSNGRAYVDYVRIFAVKPPGSPDAILQPIQPTYRRKEGTAITLFCDLRLADIQSFKNVTHWEWHMFKAGHESNAPSSNEIPLPDGVEITTIQNGEQYSKQLTITNLQSSDTNFYSCRVSYETSQNEEVREMTNTYLIVEESLLEK